MEKKKFCIFKSIINIYRKSWHTKSKSLLLAGEGGGAFLNMGTSADDHPVSTIHWPSVVSMLD